MGSETKVVPTTSNTQQTVEIPQYIKDAGMAATAKAQDYASTPFQGFGGEQVAPLTQNQNSAISMAGTGAGAGQGDMAAARAYLQQAGGGVTNGTNVLNGATGVAANATGAAKPALTNASTLFGMQGNDAMASRGAGTGQADLGATLASLAGAKAAGSTDAGAGDLTAARGYNAKSAAPVTADQITSYFNPYVQDALDPVIANLTRSNQQTDAGIRAKSAMSGAFGGARSGLQQSSNTADLLRQIATTSGAGYSDAYDKALSASQADKARQAAAAGTSLNIGAGANTEANDAVQRLIQSGDASGRAGTTISDLATASGNRLSSAGANQITSADAINRSNTSDVDRLLSLIQPGIALSGANQDMAKTSAGLAASDSQLTTDQINRLLTTGALGQTQQQNVDNAAYQQYQNQQDYALKQLNALIAAAGGVPYGTSTDSKTQGTQVVQTSSGLGQVLGAASTLGGAAIMASNRDWKEGFEDVDDEDILARFRNLDVERYRYKPEVRDAIGDDGRDRIGPMAQDWAKEFGGDGKVIPMPEMMGALTSAVRALERRTARAA